MGKHDSSGAKYILDFSLSSLAASDLASAATKYLPMTALGQAVARQDDLFDIMRPMGALGEALAREQTVLDQMRPLGDCNELQRYSTSLDSMMPGAKIEAALMKAESFAQATMTASNRVLKMTDALSAANELVRYADALGSFADQLRSFDALATSALPTLLQGQDLAARIGGGLTKLESLGPSIGLLADLEHDHVAAFLTSADRLGEVSVTPFLRRPSRVEPQRRVQIPTDVRCWICKGHLFVVDEEVYEDDRGELRRDVEAFPVCPACFDRLKVDPTWVLAELGRAERARRRLVGLPSIGVSDGVQRGELRLVQRDDERQDDGDSDEP